MMKRKKWTPEDDALEEIAAAPPAMSELVLDAHEAEDTPGTPVEDAVEIRALFGL